MKGYITFSVYVFMSALMAAAEPLPGTEPLEWEGDLAARMVEGIDQYLIQAIEENRGQRAEMWEGGISSEGGYQRVMPLLREELGRITGVVDERENVELEIIAPLRSPGMGSDATRGLVGSNGQYEIYAVRWNVIDGVEGEGLLLQPRGVVIANVIALPDCDWTPEMLAGLQRGIPATAQFARRLVEQGCRVIIPTLINRQDTWSGIAGIRMTNQPHREFIYRAAYEMGRNIIGYEVQKVLAAVDWFEEDEVEIPTIVYGYGEGGLIAFHAAALDQRIEAVVVSGYFQPREDLWQEPIYRNVWSLLRTFGDAEIAAMIAPRVLIVEHCRFPEITGPPTASAERSGAAPGRISTPEMSAVRREVERARNLIESLQQEESIFFVESENQLPGDEETLRLVLQHVAPEAEMEPSGEQPARTDFSIDPERRQKRQFEQLLEHTQQLMRDSEFTRQGFWTKADASSVENWVESSRWYRDYLHDEVIGRLPEISLPPNARTRLVYDEPTYRGYEVLLDVYPEIFAYGILLLPKEIEAGEKRPVVVCQHGLEGRPQSIVDPEIEHRSYHQYGVRLAEEGFIVYAPQNPYIGEDHFRVLQRKGNPLKYSLFSFIVRQHEQTLNWLKSLEVVDPERIGFYGLSYGGKTAMRVPALLEDYCLSICSADYNEWIWKNVSTRHRYSYLITGEYEMPEFNLGNTFNYAELSWLIFPRPFMVERGHHDGVAPDEWVAYEYARTRRHYALLGLGEHTEIEFFTGPHTIHGVGTFKFLRTHLRWGK
jgi:dienelactone hydrolase